MLNFGLCRRIGQHFSGFLGAISNVHIAVSWPCSHSSKLALPSADAVVLSIEGAAFLLRSLNFFSTVGVGVSWTRALRRRSYSS